MVDIVRYKYGDFSKSQIEDYKSKMQKKIFWLILYTDEQTKYDYEDVDVVLYHTNILTQIAGLNSLFGFPKNIVDIQVALESALAILKSDNFEFSKFRKLILDAGAMMSRLEVGE